MVSMFLASSPPPSNPFLDGMAVCAIMAAVLFAGDAIVRARRTVPQVTEVTVQRVVGGLVGVLLGCLFAVVIDIIVGFNGNAIATVPMLPICVILGVFLLARDTDKPGTVGCSPWALAAAWMVIIVFAMPPMSLLLGPVPLLLGVVGIRDLDLHPGRHGLFFAVLGVLVGSLVTLLLGQV